MTPPSDADRKIRQLDNDVRSIYELLADMQLTQIRHGNRLEEHSQLLTTVAATQMRQGNRLDEHSAKLDTLETKVDALDTKMDTVLELLQAR